MAQRLNREEIKDILPHREDMALLDEAALLDDGTAQGLYRVRGDEFFLRGHFPGNPVVPGVIQCEILAQSACVLLADALQPGMIPMYTGMDKVRFRRPVRPGDVIETRCRITRARPPFYFAQGTVSVDGTVCTSAEFSFAIVGD